MVCMFPRQKKLAMPILKKNKPLRLKEKKKLDLYRAVAERDGNRCVSCGKWIQEGEIPHHIIYKSEGGGDSIDNLTMLCHNPCHHSIHHGDMKEFIDVFITLHGLKKTIQCILKGVLHDIEM